MTTPDPSPDRMGPDEMITALGRVLAGVPLGEADDAWAELHRGLIGPGWAAPEDYERAIRKVLRGAR